MGRSEPATPEAGELQSPASKLPGGNSRKLTPFDRRQLQRGLAIKEKTRSQLAREFGVSPSYVTQFAKMYAHEIGVLQRALDDAFAGLWIASKENRLLAHQADFAMALANEKRDHHEWIKSRTAILHAAAEELGQLPPRATVAVMPVTHVVVGVDVSALT